MKKLLKKHTLLIISMLFVFLLIIALTSNVKAATLEDLANEIDDSFTYSRGLEQRNKPALANALYEAYNTANDAYSDSLTEEEIDNIYNALHTRFEQIEAYDNATAELLEENTVSFKDNLSLNFLVSMDSSIIDGAYVKLTYNHYGDEKVLNVNINPNDKNGADYRIRCPLTASEMMIDVQADLYLKDINEPISTRTRSIRNYIVSVLNDNVAPLLQDEFKKILISFEGI